jgi:hypothetical protein
MDNSSITEPITEDNEAGELLCHMASSDTGMKNLSRMKLRMRIIHFGTK